MKKALLLFLLTSATQLVFAQQVITFPVGNTQTAHPLTVTNGGIQKVQILYTPSDLSGARINPHLTSIYLRFLGNVSSPLVVNDLKIRMGQLSQSNFNSNQFFDSLQTVLVEQPIRSFTANDIQGNYLRIQLDHFFTYDSTKTLVLEISASQTTGLLFGAATLRTGRRLSANTLTATQGNIDNQQWNLGFDLSNLRPFDAQLVSIMQPVGHLLAAGKHPVQLQLRNNSTDTLQQLQLQYSWRGQTVLETWQGLALPGQFFTFQFADSITVVKLRTDTLHVRCQILQGGPDPDTTNNELSKIITAHTGGSSFSVGRITSDFISLNAAIAHLNNQGLQGPVVLELESGTYNSHFQLGAIAGSNASRVVTIRSKAGHPDSVIILGPTAPALSLNATAHLQFEQLTFRRTGHFPNSVQGLIRINNTGFIQFRHCKMQVTGLSANGTTDGQHNVIVTNGNNLRFSNCDVEGGRYSFQFLSAQNIQANIRIDSSRIIEPTTAIYKAELISNFIFNRNLVVKSTSQPDFRPQMEHFLGNGFTITNNTIRNITHGNFFKLTDIGKGSQLANLIANNLIDLRQLSAPSFMEAVVTDFIYSLNFVMEHNNIRTQGFQSLPQKNAQFNFYSIASMYDGIRVTNNAFSWSTIDTNDVFLSCDSNVTPNRILFDNNIYNLPGATGSNVLTRSWLPKFSVGSLAGWDASSQLATFQLDSAMGYRILPSTVISRQSNTSALVPFDITGKLRSLPVSDIGAYQEDVVIRPILNHTPIADTAWLGPRTVLAGALFSQPTDTLVVQLVYKRASDSSWISVNAQRLANNQYQGQIDLALFPTNTYGPVVIQYFFRYSLPGQEIRTLPLGGTASSPPTTLWGYTIGPALAGDYRLGQNGDIPTLRELGKAMAGGNINAPVQIFLIDTFYHVSQTLELGNYNLLNPQWSVTLRPDVNKHVNIRVDSMAFPNWDIPGIRLSSVENFRWSGRDSLGGGSLTLSALQAEVNFMALSCNVNRANKVVIEHTLFVSRHPFQAAHSGILLASPASATSDLTEIQISDNRFIACQMAFSGRARKKLVIERNVIGDSTDHTRKISGAFNLSCSTDSLIFRNNILQQYWFNPTAYSFFIGRIMFDNQGLFMTNNVFSNLGFKNQDTLNTYTSGTFSILHIERSNTTQLVGNVINDFHFPLNRLGNTEPFVWRVITFGGAFDYRSVPGPFNFINNTIRVGVNPTGNLRIRPTLFHFNISPNVQIINNLIAASLPGTDTSRLRGQFFGTSASSQLLFKRFEIYNNVFATTAVGALPYFRNGEQVADNSLIAFEQRLLAAGAAFPGPNREVRGVMATLLPQAALPAPAISTLAKSNGRSQSFSYDALLDLNGLPRMASGSSQPDIGAYVLPVSANTEINQPLLTQAQFDTLTYACEGETRTFSVTAIDSSSGIQGVWITMFEEDKTTQVPLSLTSGNRINGVWTGTVPTDTLDRIFEGRFMALDSAGNTGWSTASRDYINFKFKPQIQAPSVLTPQDTLSAVAQSMANYPLLFTEVTLNQLLPHATPNLAPYLLISNNAFVEITNIGTDTVDLTGCKFRSNTDFQNPYSLPNGHRLPPGARLVLSKIGGPSQPTLHYFNMNNPEILPSIYFNQVYFLLEGPAGEIIDHIAFFEGENTTPSSLPSWIGDGIYVGLSNTIAGFQLLGTDVNGSKNWAVYSASQPGTLGSFNPGLPRRKSPTYTWSGLLQASGMKITGGPFFGGTSNTLELNAGVGNCRSQIQQIMGVSGNDSTDIIPPVLFNLQRSNNFFNANCHNLPRSLSVEAADSNGGSGVIEVWLVMQMPNGIQRWLVPRSAGTPGLGTYSIDLRHELRNGRLSLVARDLAQNSSDTLPVGYFEGNRNRVTLMNDTAINLGTSATLRAVARNKHRQSIQISEVVLNANPNMQAAGSLPPGMNLAANDEVIEITNMSDDSVFVGGITFFVFGPSSFAPPLHQFPLPEYVVPPRGNLFLVGSNLPQAGENIFKLPFPANFLLPTGSYSMTLRDTLFANFTFLSALVLNSANSNVPSNVYSGAGIVTSASAVGVQRISASTNAAGWQITNGSSQPTSLGSAFQLPQILPAIRWYGPTGFLGTGNSMQVSPTQTSLYFAVIDSGSCATSDTVLVRVNGSAFQNDLALLNFVRPNYMSTSSSALQISVQVTNLGNAPLAGIPIELWVNNQRLATEVLGNYLDIGDTTTLSFQTPWLPPRGGIHTILVKSNVMGDVQAANDTLSTQVLGLEAPDFARITAILSPSNTSSVTDSSLVRVRITNSGTTPMNAVRLHYFDGLGTSFKQDFSVNLAIGASEMLTFSKYFVPISTGSHALCVRTEALYEDQACVGLWATSSPTLPAKLQNVYVYPNPTNQHLYVRMPEGVIPMSYKIIDLRGRTLLRFDHLPSNESQPLDVSQLSDGLYLLLIQSEAGSSVQRFVVQR